MMADIDRLVGKWRIIETSAWPREHLDLCGPAFLQVDAAGQGDMALGALDASLDCAFTPHGIDFEWNGADEGDQVRRRMGRSTRRRLPRRRDRLPQRRRDYLHRRTMAAFFSGLLERSHRHIGRECVSDRCSGTTLPQVRPGLARQGHEACKNATLLGRRHVADDRAQTAASNQAPASTGTCSTACARIGEQARSSKLQALIGKHVE